MDLIAPLGIELRLAASREPPEPFERRLLKRVLAVVDGRFVDRHQVVRQPIGRDVELSRQPDRLGDLEEPDRLLGIEIDRRRNRLRNLGREILIRILTESPSDQGPQFSEVRGNRHSSPRGRPAGSLDRPDASSLPFVRAQPHAAADAGSTA